MVEVKAVRHTKHTRRTTGTAKDTVDRDIHFYRVDSDIDDILPPKVFDPVALVNTIREIKGSTRSTELVGPDGHANDCWIDQVSPRPRVRFGVFRRTGLPQVPTRGKLSSLGVSEVVEVIHAVFIAHTVKLDDAYRTPYTMYFVGSDFNFYGPRTPRLATYMSAITKGTCAPFELRELLHHDTAQQLTHLRTIRKFQLRIQRSYVAEVAKANKDLSTALDTGIKLGDPDEVEIVLKTHPRGKGWLSNAILQVTARLAELPNIRDGATYFRVRGERDDTQRMATIDLLGDRLIVSRKISLNDDGSGTLIPEAAYEAIEGAFEELANDLVLASGVTIGES